MKRWTQRLRGALGMGVSWAIAWVAAGLVIGVSSMLRPALPWSAFSDVFDAPLPALAMPGFIGGALFSIVLGVAGRRRRFDQLSLPTFTAWGALGGAVLAFVPQGLAAVELATISARYASPWQLTAMIIGPLTLLSAASAAATLLVARGATKRNAGHAAGNAVGGADPVARSRALPTGEGLDALRDFLRESPSSTTVTRDNQPSGKSST